MRDVLGTMGRALLAAVAMTERAAESLERLMRAEADVAHLRGLLDHTMGQRDAFRDELENSNRHRVANASDTARLQTRVRELHGELRIATGERDGYRSDVQGLTDRLGVASRSCVELKDEVDRAREERDAVEVARREVIDLLSDREATLKWARGELATAHESLASERGAHATARSCMLANEAELLRASGIITGLKAELAALRKPVESSAPTMLDEVGGVEPCAWCLRPSDPAWLTPAEQGNPELHFCEPHGDAHGPPSYQEALARIAVRAESCPSRRTSADPLAVACETCGAFAWHGCGGGPETRGEVAP